MQMKPYCNTGRMGNLSKFQKHPYNILNENFNLVFIPFLTLFLAARIICYSPHKNYNIYNLSAVFVKLTQLFLKNECCAKNYS